MSQDINRCMDPAVYTSNAAGTSFEEARAIVLGKYAEKELDPHLENNIREHLNRCQGCSQFLRQLEDTEEFRLTDTTVVYASCPSSQNLDHYLFRPEELSGNEQKRIEQHLQDCVLCKEETDWLTTLGRGASMPAIKQNWIQYLSIAAALFFMALSIFLFLERASLKNTEQRLRAAAIVKEPDEIDFTGLENTSVALPEKMWGVYEKGVESLKQRRFQEAIRHLELVATAHPDHSGAVFLLGYSYYQMNEPERAFQLCDRAEHMIPHSLERCLSLVNVALKSGHFGRAIREISALHHSAPDHPEVKETYDRITAITRGRILKL